MGNCVAKTDSGGSGAGASYTYDAANRLTSVTTSGGASTAVTSDADENTLTDASGRAYTWDSENRMASCAYKGDTTTYTYGYDGLRRSATKDGVTTCYVYDGTSCVAEMRRDGSGNLITITDYLLGSRGVEAKIDETNQTEAYYETDNAGGTGLVYDANGQKIVKYRGVTSWYIYDGLGSVLGAVDQTGVYTAQPLLDVYGVQRNTIAATTKNG